MRSRGVKIVYVSVKRLAKKISENISSINLFIWTFFNVFLSQMQSGVARIWNFVPKLPAAYFTHSVTLPKRHKSKSKNITEADILHILKKVMNYKTCVSAELVTLDTAFMVYLTKNITYSQKASLCHSNANTPYHPTTRKDTLDKLLKSGPSLKFINHIRLFIAFPI